MSVANPYHELEIPTTTPHKEPTEWLNSLSFSRFAVGIVAFSKNSVIKSFTYTKKRESLQCLSCHVRVSQHRRGRGWGEEKSAVTRQESQGLVGWKGRVRGLPGRARG